MNDKTEQQWGESMEYTAEMLERVMSDLKDYAEHYGKYTDFVDGTIHLKWNARPIVARLRELAKYAKENKLETGTYGWSMED